MRGRRGSGRNALPGVPKGCCRARLEMSFGDHLTSQRFEELASTVTQLRYYARQESESVMLKTEGRKLFGRKYRVVNHRV